MKEKLISKASLDNHLGCFGNFNIQNPICKKLCVLSLRCAIERDHNNRLELLEDLMSSDCEFIKLQ
ncbi:MAG: hypothetical protein ABIK98_10770 [Pseudomonadota bacterium]|uniref:Uncharacterized protein n=1 Tax=Candidatus Desulfatibia profunda TaxID=2841695 RepID=A0A8J6NS01_9BACT|nr:hypothetical protein [Candidatus Desulfatibia profunda]MBL7180211.1 hypothetical protein [Desulfobacterales bacterium]MBU0699320.1 hypothetical protein [Pseudomonadota bacterium]